MAYTTIKKPSDYFNTVLYDGNATARNITTGFRPDWVWLKSRSNADHHQLFDVLRGAEERIYSSLNYAQGNNIQALTSFNSDGFSLGFDQYINGSGKTYASWNWKANGAGSSNTDGNVTTTVSVNTTSGFSIVSYSGTGSASSTMGHGLGSTPGMIMIKRLNAAEDWRVWHKNLSATTGKNLRLNTTDAEDSNNSFFYSAAPNANTFNPGSGGNTNSAAGTYIAYCFAEKTGYSKFGSYTGNGNADGTFVYTGFKPAFIMVKRTDDTSNWQINDNKRDVDNVQNTPLFANLNNAESTDTSWDALSNGFKMRQSFGSKNASGGTYIYMAFAEEPLVGDNPCTAR